MPEEWREYVACQRFRLSPESYAAMPWQKTEMWFAFAQAEEDARPKRKR